MLKLDSLFRTLKMELSTNNLSMRISSAMRSSSVSKITALLLMAAMIAAAGAGFFGGCTTETTQTYVKDGKTYGVVKGSFRHRWWNYYERALSFTEGAFYEEAVRDLMAAMKQRDADQRNARTYGMHFVDYYPHRELGVVYFKQKKYIDARRELETSLNTADTGKAKHYLNQVRRVLLEASQADTAPPTIKVADIPAGEITNRLKFALTGEVADDSYAYKVSINDTPQFIELSAKKIPFSKTIKLKKGLNQIKIKTADLLGKVTEKKVSIMADFEGPAFNVSNFIDGQSVGKSKIVLKGALADATGITALKVNDQVLAFNKEREVEFALGINLEKGANKILLAATDVAGNTTTGELNLAYAPKLAQERIMLEAAREETNRSREPVLLAFSGSVVSDADPHFLYAAAARPKPGAAFRLNFKDLVKTQTVYYGTMFVDGSATGANHIETVTINGEPLLIVPGRTVYFNQMMELEEGANKLTIEVVDTKGNAASKTVTVIRKVPKVHQIGNRMSLAILPFEVKGEVSMAGEVAHENLVGAFVQQERFNIVTRGSELEAVLREQKLSQTDLVDKQTAVRIGKLVAAEGILMGTVRETKDSIEIYARLVNTETSTVMEAKDVFGQDKAISQIQYLTNGLALKLKHSFPLIEGMVIKAKGNDIYADFGSFKRIKKEMKFIVFRQGETIVHPVTGKVLGRETEELGVATVVSVFEDMSIGKLIADFDTSNILAKDLIITK